MSGYDVVRLIDRKRLGGEVPPDDLRSLVRAYLDDQVSDAQMSAFFMAGVIQGFTAQEAVALTDAYVDSGDVVDLGALDGPTVDKHSTGGVADSTTFVVGPLVAACGLQLAKLSGRGLGHTGGTLDKLESIPGMQVDLRPEQLAAQVNDIGLAVAAATTSIAPGDKRTYALRDVTGTVASEGLIAASIMSKKIAGGADNIVLDVKSGDGAFLSDPSEASPLAKLCIEIGEAKGRRVGALITDMSQPLGPAIGNALEVAAAIDVLHGAPGPLREVSLALATRLLELVGEADGAERARRALDDGSALERFARFVEAQGGDPRVAEAPGEVLEIAPLDQVVLAPHGGHVGTIGCRALGEAAVRLGAGRLSLGEAVDPAVGITVGVRIGDAVEAGQPLARVHARDADAADLAASEVLAAIGIVEEPVASVPPVLEVVGG